MTAPCSHPDAEPVDLSTGETVAAVCATCLARLPAEWLVCQLDGEHDEAVEITEFGSRARRYLCGRCGGSYEEAR